MRFMMIVKANADSEAGVMPSTDLFAAMGAFNQSMIDAGVLVSAEGLRPSADGARIQIKGTRRTVIDGPFAETKELVAGFWIIDVASRQEAIDWAIRCPNVDDAEGVIEVRRIAGLDDLDEAMTPELRDQEDRQRAELTARNQKR